MKVGKRISEADFVAGFVCAEFQSKRFGARVRGKAKEENVPDHIFLKPNTKSKSENALRAKVLGLWRGWPKKIYFKGLPKRVSWKYAQLSVNDIENLLYVIDPKWSKFSNETRLVKKGAEYIFKMPRNSNPALFVRGIYKDLKKGKHPPRIIVVTDPERSKFVVMEGSARSTAYVKALKEGMITQIPIILGVSKKMSRWILFW